MDTSKRRIIPLKTFDSPYVKGVRFLVIPADLNSEVIPVSATVEALDGYSAWLKSESDSVDFSDQEELLLIEFRARYVYTHRVRVKSRHDGKVLVGPPTLTEKEKTQLAPSTGRYDYRVEVDVPIQVRYLDAGPGSLLRTGRLRDLSRGGMSFVTRDPHPYHEGERINLQVVSWEYPVNVNAEINRVRVLEDGQQVAVKFQEEMAVRQREMVSGFIIQVQRRDALSRSLPSDQN